MKRGYAAIGLIAPKYESNLGGVLRAATCFGADLIVLEGHRFHHTPMNTCRTERHIPVLEVEKIEASIPYACEPIIVEILPGAHPLTTFRHPQAALYIFGPEDGSVPERLHKYRSIVIPSTHCLNLAASVNVVLYDRVAKRRAGVEW